MTDIETVRVALSATAFGSWAPEERRPDQRVALDALDRIERVVEAASRIHAVMEQGGAVRIYGPQLDVLAEALGALDDASRGET